MSYNPKGLLQYACRTLERMEANNVSIDDASCSVSNATLYRLRKLRSTDPEAYARLKAGELAAIPKSRPLSADEKRHNALLQQRQRVSNQADIFDAQAKTATGGKHERYQAKAKHYKTRLLAIEMEIREIKGRQKSERERIRHLIDEIVNWELGPEPLGDDWKPIGTYFDPLAGKMRKG